MAGEPRGAPIVRLVRLGVEPEDLGEVEVAAQGVGRRGRQGDAMEESEVLEKDQGFVTVPAVGERRHVGRTQLADEVQVHQPAAAAALLTQRFLLPLEQQGGVRGAPEGA